MFRKWLEKLRGSSREPDDMALGTTRPQLEAALAAIATLDYAPHLEVETYTWGVLPAGGRPPIVYGIAKELAATRKLLDDLRT